MSDNTIEIIESVNIIEIETSVSDTMDNLSIDIINEHSLEVVNGYAGIVVYASDIIGLDNYLSNFIDTYEIDCGTP